MEEDGSLWTAASGRRPNLWRPVVPTTMQPKRASRGAGDGRSASKSAGGVATNRTARSRWRVVCCPNRCGVSSLLQAVAAAALLAMAAVTLLTMVATSGLLAGDRRPNTQAMHGVDHPHSPMVNCTTADAAAAAKPSLWYSPRPFHSPPLFPLCSMDACFNFSRCPLGVDREPRVFAYWPGTKYFEGLNGSRWHTDDPSQACFFFVFMSVGQPKRFTDLPHWGKHGSNHVLISFSDSWSGPPPSSIGRASLMLTDAHKTIMRAGFDGALPLPQGWKEGAVRRMGRMRNVPVQGRRYLMTFMGTRYLGQMNGNFRSTPAFKRLHNGRDIVVVTQCGGSTNRRLISADPSLLPSCAADAALFRSYSFPDLMNATYALVPAGRQACTYRFMEALSAGAIPVVVADNWKLPFDDIILWHRCLLLFPTTELHRIVPTIRAIHPAAAELRRQRCVSIFNEFLSSDEVLLQSVMQSLKARVGGIMTL